MPHIFVFGHRYVKYVLKFLYKYVFNSIRSYKSQRLIESMHILNYVLNYHKVLIVEGWGPPLVRHGCLSGPEYICMLTVVLELYLVLTILIRMLTYQLAT